MAGRAKAMTRLGRVDFLPPVVYSCWRRGVRPAAVRARWALPVVGRLLERRKR